LVYLAIIRNNITYLEFYKELSVLKLFTPIDIRKSFPQFDTKRLVEWQKKGHIKKLVNKWYIFSDIPITENIRYRISNCLHHPSYISLESALAYYHLIPEAVYTQQAVCTRRTINYQTPLGSYNYRQIKTSVYFGYTPIQHEGFPVLMAEKEKAILDFLYLNASIKNIEDIEALRLNIQELKSDLDWIKIKKYSLVFENAELMKRIKLLKKFITDADPAPN
jgi:predicted transcriptional regulator of viral defense system